MLIDRDGQRLLSRRVSNDQPDLVALINTIQYRVVDPVWAIDLAGGSTSLVIALLLQHGQRVVYLPGIAVNRATAGYRGEGKTDAKYAAIIADQARMRRDLRELHVLDEDIAQLQLLSSYRADLVADRTRSINRLRALLAGIFPALERVLDFTNRGPLILIGSFQTPTVIRRLGTRFGWLVGWRSAESAALPGLPRPPPRPPADNLLYSRSSHPSYSLIVSTFPYLSLYSTTSSANSFTFWFFSLPTHLYFEISTCPPGSRFRVLYLRTCP